MGGGSKRWCHNGITAMGSGSQGWGRNSSLTFDKKVMLMTYAVTTQCLLCSHCPACVMVLLNVQADAGDPFKHFKPSYPPDTDPSLAMVGGVVGIILLSAVCALTAACMRLHGTNSSNSHPAYVTCVHQSCSAVSLSLLSHSLTLCLCLCLR